MIALRRSSLRSAVIAAAGLWLALPPCQGVTQPAPAPQSFLQEVAVRPDGLGTARLLDLASDGSPLVSDGVGWFRIGALGVAPVAAPWPLEAGEGWIFTAGEPRRIPVPLTRVRHVWHGTDGSWVATTNGVIRLFSSGEPTVELTGCDVQQVATGSPGVVLAATDRGLWRRDAEGSWQRIRLVDQNGRLSTEGMVRGVAIAPDGTWWVAEGDRVGFRRQERWHFLSGKDGLPHADFTSVAAGPTGEVWFGTRRGVVRFDGADWAYREGPRWLPGNEVRAVVVAPGAEPGSPRTRASPALSGWR